MAAPDLTLNKGQILLIQSSTSLGIEVDNSPFLNGVVSLINDLSDLYIVGDLVLFDPTNATKFKYSSEDYFLITENKVFYKENIAP